VFRAGERFSAELRGEAFNIFNRVRFGYGNTNINSADFGRVTGQSGQINTPRQLQVGLKLAF